MKFSEHNVGTVPSEYFRFCGLHTIKFIWIANHKLTSLQREFMRIGTGYAAAFDGGMTDSVTKPDRFCFIWERMTILTPDCLNARHSAVGFASRSKRRFQ